jgi:hypothetical protein
VPKKPVELGTNSIPFRDGNPAVRLLKKALFAPARPRRLFHRPSPESAKTASYPPGRTSPHAPFSARRNPRRGPGRLTDSAARIDVVLLIRRTVRSKRYASVSALPAALLSVFLSSLDGVICIVLDHEITAKGIPD